LRRMPMELHRLGNEFSAMLRGVCFIIPCRRSRE
jgi:hypothetical protein